MTMNEPDDIDPNRYAAAEEACRELCGRMQALAETQRGQQPTRNDWVMFMLAALFLLGQIVAAVLKLL